MQNFLFQVAEFSAKFSFDSLETWTASSSNWKFRILRKLCLQNVPHFCVFYFYATFRFGKSTCFRFHLILSKVTRSSFLAFRGHGEGEGVLYTHFLFVRFPGVTGRLYAADSPSEQLLTRTLSSSNPSPVLIFILSSSDLSRKQLKNARKNV